MHEEDSEASQTTREMLEQLDWRELTAVILMSVTAIFTAWSGFQSSKWGGEMSIAFSQASTTRLEAARLEADANRALTIQVGLYTEWANAIAAGNQAYADYLVRQFPEPLSSAFDAWWSQDPRNNPDVPENPFEMPEFVLPASLEAAAADEGADALFAKALDNNRRGDNYTLMAVVFALVLFFAAVSGRVRELRNQRILLGIAVVLFIGAVAVVLSYPKII